MDKKIKILIAEDDEPISKAMELKLKKSGFDPTMAVDGFGVIDAVSKDNFDLIILDLMMPVKNGFETLEELQKKGNKTPIIVSSNLSQEEDFEKAKKLGAVDYFVKSEKSIAEIVESIEKFLGKIKSKK